MDRFQNAIDVIIHIAKLVLVYPSLVDAILKGNVNLKRFQVVHKPQEMAMVFK